MSKLDIDVIEAVCDSIDNTQDLLSVSLASSVLRDIAIRQLLRSHTIHLKNRKAVRAFYAFIFSRKPNLAPHIRSLVIPANAWFQVAPPWETDLPEDVEHVMDILECAENLDTLDLSLPPSYELSPRLCLTLATVRSVRHLSLSKGSRPWDTCWVHHALQAIRSPLVALCVRSRPERYTDFSPSTVASHFSQSFSQFSTSSTLTSLEVGHIPMYDDSFLQLPQFPSVRSLTLTRPLTREPNLAALLHLFPSLDRTLSLRMHDRHTCPPEAFAEIQENNRRAQAASRWTKLDTLDGDYTAVQLLALQCPVRRLTTNEFEFSCLGCVRPRHLVIDHIHIPYYEEISLFHSDEEAVENSSSVTHAVLIVACNTREYEDAKRFGLDHDDMHWRTILKHTVRALAVFKNLTHARLVFHCARDPPSAELEHDDAYDLDYGDLDRLARKMRAAAASGSESVPPPRQVLAACPALRRFVMTVAGRDETGDDVASRGWCRTRAWRVVDAPGGQGQGQGQGHAGRSAGGSRKRAARMLEQLGEYDARRVIEDEGLGLPEAWEEKLRACRT